MKESEGKSWKEEILHDFVKPTHEGFNDEVMGMIGELENKPVLKPEPLISARQWFFAAMTASIIVLLAVFVQYRIELNFSYVETFSVKFMDWINANTEILWTAFALVGALFVISLINSTKMIFKQS